MRGNGGEGGGAREGARAGSVTREWTSGSVTFKRLGRLRGREGKRRGERGVRCVGATRHGGDCGASPRQVGGAPTVSRPAVSRMRRARAARCCSDSGVLALTWKGPGGSES
jgi:hypothetical protein